MIPTFNRAMVVETIQSVLAQDPGPERMHIEVVDNHSTNLDVEALVRDLGHGRVAFHRNPQNIGLYNNLNNCVQRARGQWVHILHDDDLVYPGFYHAMEAAAKTEPTIGAAFCSTCLIDAQGRQITHQNLEHPIPGVYPDLLGRLLRGNAIQFPSMVVRRQVYADIGPFDPAIDYVSDWDMWMRIAAKYPVWYEPRALAGYRRHEGSETSSLLRSGRERRGYTAAADRWLLHAGSTPENLALHAGQKESFAHDGLHIAAASFTRGDFYAGVHQLKAALDCSAAPSVLQRLGAFLPHIHTHALLDSATRSEFLARFQAPRDIHAWHQMLDFLAKNTPP